MCVSGDGRAAYWACFVRLIIQGLWGNRFQLLLTVLTMSVGTVALSLTYFLGEGALNRVWEDVEKMMGSWVIAYHDAGADQSMLRQRERPDFSDEDYAQIDGKIPAARFTCPIYMNAQPVVCGDVSREVPVDGIAPVMAEEPMFRPLRGNGFSQSAHEGLTWECLITETAAKEFGIEEVKRQVLVLGGQPFAIAGIIPDPPRIDRRFSARVVVPYKSARILWLPPGCIGHILVAWHNAAQMGLVVQEVRDALDRVRGEETYYLSSSQFGIERSKNIVANFMMIGAAQALFCIIVASIGVLNVMLTNVTRRAHEFSVRIAMGARRGEILSSVVVESALIGILGALVGISLSVLVAPHLSRLLAARIAQAVLLKPVYCMEGFVYPILICGGCGLVAGLVPALRVRKLDVLASLRSEA